MSDMTISEIRAKKKGLDENLTNVMQKLVEDFSKETGVRVESVVMVRSCDGEFYPVDTNIRIDV